MTDNLGYGFLCGGILNQAEDNWCDICLKPSMLAGQAYMLKPDGVYHWGTVRGCSDCKDWAWTDLSGELRNDVKNTKKKETGQ
jgi:hypothetical protein